MSHDPARKRIRLTDCANGAALPRMAARCHDPRRPRHPHCRRRRPRQHQRLPFRGAPPAPLSSLDGRALSLDSTSDSFQRDSFQITFLLPWGVVWRGFRWKKSLEPRQGKLGQPRFAWPARKNRPPSMARLHQYRALRGVDPALQRPNCRTNGQTYLLFLFLRSSRALP